MSKRFDYVKYDEKAHGLQESIKSQFMCIEAMLNNLPQSREKSLVLTKMEEAYMWIGKAIREDQIARNGSAELQEHRTNS